MKKRTVVYIGVALLILFGGFMGKDPVSGLLGLDFSFSPVLPHIQLPGEIVFHLGGVGITNTFITTLIAFFVILLMAFMLKPKSRTADEVPTGFYNFFEMIIEGAYGYVEQSAGKWARSFFPFFMTFILWIVISNWIGILPGIESIGLFHDLGAHGEVEHETDEHETDEHAVAEEPHGDLRRGIFLLKARPDDHGKLSEDAHWGLVPFFRSAATDLNFTLALAIISVVMTQYYGMRAQGMKYWKKFFVWDGEAISKNPLAVMDSGVGLLEFISEMFKIVSFALPR